jgi:hypothetical protein
MGAEASPLGRTGVLLIGTRGTAGPGEVLLKIRGGSETYRAYSDVPIPKGVTVLVVGCHAHRVVDVVVWSDPFTVS